MVVSVPLSNGSTVEQIAHPIKMSRSEPMYRHVGVKLGEQNDEILEEFGCCGEAQRQEPGAFAPWPCKQNSLCR